MKLPLCIGPRNGAVRLLAFHHAGGSAAAFLPLRSALPEDAELVLFQLPGRGPHERAERPGDFTAAATELRAQATAMVDRPAVVIGHSLGSLLAHAVVAGLPASRLRHVRTLIMSAVPCGPEGSTPGPPAHSAAVLEQRLREYGGSPASLFADPARLEQAVQLYGDDLRLTETYPKVEIARVPHVFWYGTEDSAHDARRLHRWAEHAGGSPETQAFPGGHFFLFETPEPASALAARVAAARPARV